MSGPNHPRGTSNTNDRGSAASRRARREWLIETYRADTDLIRVTWSWGTTTTDTYVISLEQLLAYDAVVEAVAVPAARCYRCSTLLTVDTVTVDRIIPGCKGGTYRRNNIRPACGRCNSITGTQVREAMKAAKAA